MVNVLKTFLIIGASITAFFFSLMIINNLPSMFGTIEATILSSAVVFIILIILVRQILKIRL